MVRPDEIAAAVESGRGRTLLWVAGSVVLVNVVVLPLLRSALALLRWLVRAVVSALLRASVAAGVTIMAGHLDGVPLNGAWSGMAGLLGALSSSITNWHSRRRLL